MKKVNLILMTALVLMGISCQPNNPQPNPPTPTPAAGGSSILGDWKADRIESVGYFVSAGVIDSTVINTVQVHRVLVDASNFITYVTTPSVGAPESYTRIGNTITFTNNPNKVWGISKITSTEMVLRLDNQDGTGAGDGTFSIRYYSK